jgi:hypothetical protein
MTSKHQRLQDPDKIARAALKAAGVKSIAAFLIGEAGDVIAAALDECAAQERERTAEIHFLTQELYNRYKTGPIDLRYTSEGRWCVMLPFGNQMWVVDGSFASTPDQALRQTIARWNARSPQYPFSWLPDE